MLSEMANSDEVEEVRNDFYGNCNIFEGGGSKHHNPTIAYSFSCK